jgi:hypothetical protein
MACVIEAELLKLLNLFEASWSWRHHTSYTQRLCVRAESSCQASLQVLTEDQHHQSMHLNNILFTGGFPAHSPSTWLGRSPGRQARHLGEIEHERVPHTCRASSIWRDCGHERLSATEQRAIWQLPLVMQMQSLAYGKAGIYGLNFKGRIYAASIYTGYSLAHDWQCRST